MAHCGVLEPEQVKEGSNSMWWEDCCGSLAWGAGGQAGICGAGKGLGSNDIRLVIYKGDWSNILRIKGDIFFLLNKGLHYGKR